MVVWCLILPCVPESGYSQVTPPITSSGLNTTITNNGTVYDITGGTRPGSGPNLFHSFGEFGVPTNNVANFLNETALPTSNILGRVTGGNPSNIFGTIQTTGFGNANLFLMNPAGIVFGPTASLNVGGSVSFTTADYLRLADGAKFNALPGPLDASISSAPVAAFGFLGPNPGAIAVQGGQLAVLEEHGISLVGGNIDITAGTLDNGLTQPARLSAPGGQINLVSVNSPGEVVTGHAAAQLTDPTLNGFMSLGNISLSQGASIETSADAAGRIVIRSGQLTMDDATLKAISMNGLNSPGDTANVPPTISITAQDVSLTNGVLITADTHGSAPAGDITFNVDTLTTKAGANIVLLNPPINDGTFNGNLIASDSRSPDAGAGPAGRIAVQGLGGPGTAAKSVTLKDTSLSTRIFGGTPDTRLSAITITADSVLLHNEVWPDETGAGAATIVANTNGTGPAGIIAINTDRLLVNLNPDETPIDGAHRMFIVTGNALGTEAGPSGIVTISGLRPESTDPARLVALHNASISSGLDGGAATLPPTNATIITAETLSLSGGTGIFSGAFDKAAAPAGSIALNVNTLRGNVKPDGTLVSGQAPSIIVSSSEVGQAGTLTISGIGPEASDAAREITLNNVQLNTVVKDGPTTITPATVRMTAHTLHLSNGSKVETGTSGSAPAGNITMHADNLALNEGATISSRTSASGIGGDISMTAVQSVSMSGGATISAESTGAGNSGNIAINAGSQFISQKSAVTTEASQASGGNIFIQATDAIRLMNSRLSTSVQGGPTTSGGNITIDPAIMTMQNSQILAQAVQGAGGNINIIAGTFLTDQSSVVSASSQFGLSGSVNIQSPVSSLSGSLATLPQRPLQVQHLLQQRCAAQANGQLSSLVVAGRDTLPSEPGGWLPSSLALLSEEVADRAPHQQQMIVSGPLDEQPAPSPHQALTSWTASCGS
jgi:filamentous hemagglutinin family protein